MKKTLLLLLLLTVAFSSCKKDDPVIVEYTVSFDSQGGSGLSPVTVPEGSKITKPSNPVKEGETFLGWYKENMYTTIWDFEKDVVTQNLTLYARWSQPGEKVYTVSFDTDGGNGIEAVSVVENEKAQQPANPAKVGFEFNGWFTDPERLTAYDFESPVTSDIILYVKWLKLEVVLVDFNVSELAANGIEWDAATKTLDITDATGSATLYFNVAGVSSIETEAVAAYDTRANSIGGISKLNDIITTGATVDGKIGMEVNVPTQSVDLKVPLDVYVTIGVAGNPGESETITIKSRPNYADTDIQPVMMKTIDNKLVFWAPVNVGAEEIPVEASSTANTDITKSCGQLFQWGRLFGFAATNNATTTGTEKFNGKTDPLGFPKGEGDLANMSEWKDKFIICSNSSPNTQGNWLVFDDGTDNPNKVDMVDGVWYQKLWNSGTEDSPIKTKYDPCPAGWRVPTLTEWKAIGVNSTIHDSWDATTKLMTITGAESSQKLILPATGLRDNSSGVSHNQGDFGYYWSSSVLSGSIGASFVYFDGDPLFARQGNRANGFSVRCVQE